MTGRLIQQNNNIYFFTSRIYSPNIFKICFFYNYWNICCLNDLQGTQCWNICRLNEIDAGILIPVLKTFKLCEVFEQSFKSFNSISFFHSPKTVKHLINQVLALFGIILRKISFMLCCRFCFYFVGQNYEHFWLISKWFLILLIFNYFILGDKFVISFKHKRS